MSDTVTDEDEDDDTEETEATDEPRHLWWGQTPWDDMPREELLRETQRLYYATEHLLGALEQVKLGNESHWLFGPKSIPTRAMALGTHALAPYRRGNAQASDIYRAFFRTAAELLFPGIVRDGWHVCECGEMTSTPLEGEHDLICTACAFQGRKPAPMRPIQWSDMAPKKD